MPLNGSIWRGSLRVIITAQGSVTHSGDGTPYYGATLNGYTLFVPDVFDVSEGFVFNVSTYDNGDGLGVQGYAYYNGPLAPIGGLYCGGGGGGTLEVLLTDVNLWCRIDGGLPQLDFTLQVFFNGSRVLGDGVTGGAYSCSFVGAGVGPSYVPLLGSLGADTSVGGGVHGIPTAGTPTVPTANWAVEATGSVTLCFEGQELQADGSLGPWLGWPVAIPSNDHVSGSSTSSITVTGSMSDSESWQWSGVYDPNSSAPWYESSSSSYSDDGNASFMLVPGGNRGLSQMAPDYRCTLYRSGFPYTRYALGDVSYTQTIVDPYTQAPPPVKVDNSSQGIVHPSLTAFKGIVGQAGVSDPVLQPLNYSCLACVITGLQAGTSDVYTEFSHDLNYCIHNSGTSTSHYKDYNFPQQAWYNGGVEDYDTNPYVADWQYHYDPVQRYFGSWGSPFWKIGQWFPPASINDDGSQDDQDAWPLDGGGSSPQYWKLARTQFNGETELAAAERTHKRTDLIGSAVETSGLTLLYDNYWPDGFMRPLGWSRSPVMDCGPSGNAYLNEICPNDLQLRQDSKPSWSSSDATLTFSAAGITVTPKSNTQTTATVMLALNGWSASPYLYPQTCSTVTVGYSAAQALNLSFGSALGGSAGVSNVNDGDTITMPTGTDGGYSGSWGIEDGVTDPTSTQIPPATFTTDHGIDEAEGGESYYAMLDPSRAQSFGGVSGRQAATMSFVLTLTADANGHAQPATIKYPTFHRAAGTPTVVYLTGATCAIIWPSGPMVMYGNEFYWDGLQWNEPPLISGLGYSPTIIDAIGWRRAFLQGVSPLRGGTTGTGAGIVIPPITTELVARYTPFEGQAIPDVDQASWSFVLPTWDGNIRFVLGNTYQELPPLAMFGAPARAAGTYAKQGSTWGGVYDLCKEPRDVVSPQTPLQVYDDNDNLVSSSQPAPTGWCIERYNPQVTNDEATDWQLKQTVDGTTTLYAKIRPWHGWAWMGGLAELGGSVSSDVALHGRHVVAYISKKKALIKIAANSDATNYKDVDPSIQADSLCVRWLRDNDEYLALMYASNSTIYYATSKDEGASFGMPTTIATGISPTFIVSKNSIRYVYYLVKNGSAYDIRGQLISNQGDVLKPEFTVKTGVDKDGVSVREAFQSQGKHLIIIDYVLSGTLMSITSSNGIDNWQ